MPLLRSERETRALRQILILSRLTSFPACLAAGRACVLARLCSVASQTSRTQKAVPSSIMKRVFQRPVSGRPFEDLPWTLVQNLLF